MQTEEIIKDPLVNGHYANRDPLIGVPDAAPIGASVGIEVGAVVGGLIGKGVVEKIDPVIEDAYWRTNYDTRHYVDKGSLYENYQPAFRTGYEGYIRHAGKPFAEAEDDLQQRYYDNRGASDLEWDKAKQATRDAWDRLDARRAANEKSI